MRPALPKQTWPTSAVSRRSLAGVGFSFFFLFAGCDASDILPRERKKLAARVESSLDASQWRKLNRIEAMIDSHKIADRDHALSDLLGVIEVNEALENCGSTIRFSFK